MAVFETLKLPKLISRKILVAVKFLNFCLDFKHGLFDFKHGLLDFKHGLLDFKHAYIVNLDNSMK